MMVRNAIICWYWELAYRKLTEKTKRYASHMGIEVPSLDIKDFKTVGAAARPKARCNTIGAFGWHPTPSAIMWWCMSFAT
jgi:hypothetical protein